MGGGGNSFGGNFSTGYGSFPPGQPF